MSINEIGWAMVWLVACIGIFISSAVLSGLIASYLTEDTRIGAKVGMTVGCYMLLAFIFITL